MLEFQKKKKIRKIIYSPIVLVILLILFIFLSKAFWNVYKKDRISAENLLRERIEIEKLIARQENLESSIEYLKTEQGIESEIRTKFRAVKSGEMVALIIDEKPTATSTTSVSSTTRSLLHRFLYWPQ